ncbi:MAG: multifunctional CCA addition/repair protein [Gammaproteobacteria bacterium]|nr:multifunctional CCA addition/repair protein [Gammaproteobacteria bacterium]
MEVYLVGGAVRDKLLGLEVTDRDWVVVGATPDAMLAKGYRAVGRDFPVFLHPDSQEEYALARTERKTGPGYTGFEVDASATVTLEEDLERRDLTINAIAETPDGHLIDPFHGQQDLEQRVLRHVSAAFVEDPVRILRVARFAARFAGCGFSVHPETEALMSQMVANGEVDHLVPERVWAETERALAAEMPDRFFTTLRDCNALARIFPELDALYGVPQPAKWHPEIDTGVHTMMVLQQAAKLSPCATVRFAALVHDLGKATTPADLLPSHHGHEKRSVALVKKLCQRLTIPNRFRDLAVLVAAYHGTVHRCFELRQSTLLKLFQRTDAYRRPERFKDFLLACEADSRGRKGLENEPYPQTRFLRDALSAVADVSVADISDQSLTGEQIARELNARRLAALRAHTQQQSSDQ